MFSSCTAELTTSPALSLKSQQQWLTVLYLNHANWARLEPEIEARVAQAPKFFDEAALLVDCSALFSTDSHPASVPTFLADLKSFFLKKPLLNWVGLRGLPEQWVAEAKHLHIPIWALGARSPTESAKREAASSASNRLVVHAVRSGQRIAAEEGDLVILGTVNPGAEVLARGHIHVYGTLRGKALAGMHGDETACIFAQQLEAELVCIAGVYQLSDHLPSTHWRKPAGIRLEDKHLTFFSLK